jgi:hypothetical protein
VHWAKLIRYIVEQLLHCFCGIRLYANYIKTEAVL